MHYIYKNLKIHLIYNLIFYNFMLKNNNKKGLIQAQKNQEPRFYYFLIKINLEKIILNFFQHFNVKNNTIYQTNYNFRSNPI